MWAPTGDESSGFDRRAIDETGVPQPVLMENAGRSAAQIAQRLFPEGSVVAFVGAGNNGGDALVLLRTLAAWGRDVGAVLVSDRGAGPEPLVHGWDVPVVVDANLDDAATRLLGGAGLVVDGILGTGVRGAPRERQAAAIGSINESGRPVLAIDIPSGVDGATGATPGAAVRADVTVSFGAPKLGTLLDPGREHAGRLVAVEIGFPPTGEADGWARVVTPAWAQARLPARGTSTHKNAVGRVLVVAGRAGMGGAAVLAVRGAFRAGAGLVRVCSAPENRSALHAAVPETIYVDPTEPGGLTDALAQSDAVAVGPGLGTDQTAAALLSAVCSDAAHPAVLDADALNLCAAEGGPDLRELTAGRPVLITPHPGEMGRLLGTEGPTPAADRVDAVKRAAAAFGCAVLLKGAPSLVSTVEGRLSVDTAGSSDFAVAGMGDLLTGVCAALLAQGLDPATAGSVGLYLSGRAARIAGRGKALTPSDVARWLPDALAERGAGFSELDLPFVLLDADAPR